MKGQRSKTSASEPERLMIESKEEKRRMGKRTNVKVNRCRLQRLPYEWIKEQRCRCAYLYSRESLASIRVQLNGTLDKHSTFPVGGRKDLTEDDRTPLSPSPECALIRLIPREYHFFLTSVSLKNQLTRANSKCIPYEKNCILYCIVV